MIGDAEGWNLPERFRRELGRPEKQVGRREPAGYEPTLEPSTRIPYQTRRNMLAHDHHAPERPMRAGHTETAQLLSETSYYCSRCQHENAAGAVSCRVCGVRFTSRAAPLGNTDEPVIAPLDQLPGIDPSVVPDGPDTGNED
jgi:hypothetical protein